MQTKKHEHYAYGSHSLCTAQQQQFLHRNYIATSQGYQEYNLIQSLPLLLANAATNGIVYYPALFPLHRLTTQGRLAYAKK